MRAVKYAANSPLALELCNVLESLSGLRIHWLLGAVIENARHDLPGPFLG